MVLEQLHCWFCDEDVDTALDRVLSNRVVSGVRCEYSDYAKLADHFIREMAPQLTCAAFR